MAIFINRCFFLQIYNEMIRDLLSPSSGILELREDAKGGVQVAGLSEVTTRSTSEVSRSKVVIKVSLLIVTSGSVLYHHNPCLSIYPHASL